MKQTDKIFDGLLVLRYRSGDKEALNLLVKRHHYGLCKHAYWYTKDKDAAKDIVQDCWNVIIIKMNNLRDPNGFKAWATKIVTRKTLDHMKIHKRKQEQLKEHSVVRHTEINTHESVEIELVLKAIKQLPQDQQIVLKLFYTQEYSMKEISEILAIATGTVKSRLFHAREKLKEIIKNNKR